jgi:hypothetical protein
MRTLDLTITETVTGIRVDDDFDITDKTQLSRLADEMVRQHLAVRRDYGWPDNRTISVVSDTPEPVTA